MNKNLVSFSVGNAKMGSIMSLSLPPVTTCRPDAPCKKKCYANRFARRRPVVRDAYARNFEIYKNDPKAFFKQLDAALCTNRFFRLHVSGDFPDASYFSSVVDVVKDNPHCSVLAFTKKYEIVNDYINEYGILPRNFKVVLSAWGKWRPDNPHKLPIAQVVFKGMQDIVPPEWKVCGGNCFTCACKGVGCWELQRGDTIALYEH